MLKQDRPILVEMNTIMHRLICSVTIICGDQREPWWNSTSYYNKFLISFKWMASVTKMTRVTCCHYTAMPQVLLVGDVHPFVNWCEELLKQCYFLAEVQVFSSLISENQNTDPILTPITLKIQVPSRDWALSLCVRQCEKHRWCWHWWTWGAITAIEGNQPYLEGKQPCGKDHYIAHLVTALLIPWTIRSIRTIRRILELPISLLTFFEHRLLQMLLPKFITDILGCH